MMSAPWQLRQDRARLTWAGLSGSICLARPGDGLGDLRLGEVPLRHARVLGIGVPGLAPGHAATLLDCRLHAGDLTAAYRESSAWPVRLDAMWRAMPLEGAWGAIELVLSVRTDALDSRPQLSVESTIQADEVLAVAEDGAARTLPATESWTTVEGGGLCYKVFRMAGLSYAEMVHAGDLQRDELLRQPDPVVRWQLRHWLFPDALEKGVILRARIRGFFLPREHDLRMLTTAAQAFAASEPPLD